MFIGKVHFTWHLADFKRRRAEWFGMPLIEINDMGHWTWNRPILLVWFCPGDHIREPASSSISSGTSVSGLRELGPSFQLLFSDQRLRLSPWQSGFPPSLDAFAISLSLVTSRRAVLTLGWATTSVIDITSLENLPCLSSELGKRHPCALEAPVWFLSAYLPSPPHTHIHTQSMKNCHTRSYGTAQGTTFHILW